MSLSLRLARDSGFFLRGGGESPANLKRKACENRVADPDPYPDSIGSVDPVRIRNPDPDKDPGGQK
jgi:hypothetical protein